MAHPLVLISGVVLNTGALTLYYHLNSGNNYRDLLLIIGVGAAAMLGYFAGGLDEVGVLLRVVPWAAILAMLLGTAPPRMRTVGGEEGVNEIKV